jgi:two-component system cell cycle response regulator
MARILVVEDNEANLYLMTYLLESFGHDTVVARDGAAGVAIASSTPVDLVICDIQLPKIGGHDVARAIRRLPALAHVPLVAVTALAMVGDQERVLAAGFDGYIAKPIAPEAFVGQVNAFLPPPLRSSSVRIAAAPAQPHASATPALTPAHILAVDDLAANLAVMQSVLEPLGYRVTTAGSMREAVSRARDERPELIIADLHMPQGSGYDLLAALQDDPRLAAVPFMFISSTEQNETERARGLARGARKFLVRPIEPETFLAEIEECLRTARLQPGG